MFGVGDSDPRPLDDGQRLFVWGSGDIEVVAEQVVSVEAPVDVHRLAEQSRALSSAIDILHGFDSPQQHGGPVSFALGYDIHAVIHAVDHIDVRMAGRTEHDFRSLR